MTAAETGDKALSLENGWVPRTRSIADVRGFPHRKHNEKNITSKFRGEMPDYWVSVTCKECGERHSAQIRVFIKDGPSSEQSISQAYGREGLSTSIQSLINNLICVCPKSGNEFKQIDPDKIFLMPIPDHVVSPSTENSSPGHVIKAETSFLEQMTSTFAQHPLLSQEERFRFSTVLREIARHPLGPKITWEVFRSMLFASTADDAQ